MFTERQFSVKVKSGWGWISFIFVLQNVCKITEDNCFWILDRPLSVDHFNQNGNIKSISHIDADVNAVENETDDNVQKAIQNVAETMNEKADIELAVRESRPNEKTDTDADKEKSNEDNRFYLFRFPMQKRIWQQFFWIIIWPMEGTIFPMRVK